MKQQESVQTSKVMKYLGLIKTITKIKTLERTAIIFESLKPTTSEIPTSILAYNSLPKKQCNGNFNLLSKDLNTAAAVRE